MYIEYVTLDGFKSYSTRTVIGPLDPHFNAVTGLNGSGKSNVLDSLCFVFGISDLSMVRATKLDELIYKQGQAGITKASVTITINNSQPNSPLMHPYKTMKEVTITRQIAIGGKNRYFINNHPATPKNIFDFYNNARMNVNNARFLIMQGRVTKVVNMKPKELLDLIEEASGTRIYENKKNVALRLIKRKDEKMQEIEKIIRDDISPMMQKLKSDKDDFLRYSSVKEEYERLKKVQTHLQFCHYRSTLEELEAMFNSKREEMESNARAVADMEKLVKTLQKKLTEQEKALKESQTQVDGYDARVDALNKSLSKMRSNRKITEKDYRDLTNSMEQTNKEIETHTAGLSEFGAVDAFNEFAKKVEADRQKLAELQELANTGGKVGQASQLKSKIAAATSELANAERVAAHLEQEIKKNERKLSEYDQSKTAYDAQIVEMNEKKSELSSKIQALKQKLEEYGQGDPVAALHAKLAKLRERRDHMEHELCAHEQDARRYRVNVRTPGAPGEYLGQVFDVVALNELGMEYSVPIHVLVGHKFSYLVAENSECARKLFKANNFAANNRKVTIVPMNDAKVGAVLTKDDLDAIRASLGPGAGQGAGHSGRCEGALGYWEVFKYDQKFTKLVQYISGNCVFCSNDRDARKIAYSHELRKRFATATLDGDKYDTGGTMSGGGNKYLVQVLKTVSTAHKIRRELGELDGETRRLKGEAEECRRLTDELYELKSKHELCTADLLGLEMRHKGGEYFTITEKINDQRGQLEARRKRIEELKEHKDTYERELANLLKSKEGDLDQKIKLLRESLKKADKQLELLREQNVDQQLKRSTLEHQINSNKQELENKKLQQQLLEQTKLNQDAEIEAGEKELSTLKAELEEKNRELGSIQEAMGATAKEREKLTASIDEANLAVKQLEYDIETCEKDMNEYQVRLMKLQNEHPYLTEDVTTPVNALISRRSNRSSISETTRTSISRSDSVRTSHRASTRDSARDSGREGGSTKSDLSYVNAKLEKLERLKEKLSRRINQKAQQMYDNIQFEYNDLMSKLSRVQNDRDKIEKTICQLDKKKQESLNEMFLKVNDHFAQIFSLLLNNATCKLVPADNRDISSGIVMKICFNNVWKNSLSELSGGQRSLLALALILAMLKVKPAPIYILDEIDAALDLSHTQNIGKMIRQQFRYSQFIIISLKEGMFNNANILFKVKFMNGRSTISRHANAALPNGAQSASASEDSAAGDEKTAAKPKRKKV